MSSDTAKVEANISGIPETMLLALHNRANTAKMPHSPISDPLSIQIYGSIDYPFFDKFGSPDGSFAARSLTFDRVIRNWLAASPEGMASVVVELGCGLETQFSRIDDGRVNWFCVDVPEAMAVREQLLLATERCRYLGASAFENAWIDEVIKLTTAENDSRIFITAQGLLPYFPESDVRKLIVSVCDRFAFAGVEMLFDILPPWLSRKSQAGGLKRPNGYLMPAMPWGVKNSQIASTLKEWNSRVESVDIIPFEAKHVGGWRGLAMMGIGIVPGLSDVLPAIVHVKMTGSKP